MSFMLVLVLNAEVTKTKTSFLNCLSWVWVFGCIITHLIVFVAIHLTNILLLASFSAKDFHGVDSANRSEIFFVPLIFLCLLLLLFLSFLRGFSALKMRKIWCIQLLESRLWFLEFKVFYQRTLCFNIISEAGVSKVVVISLTGIQPWL